MTQTDSRRILVVRTDRIGDVILTLPMVQVLREQFPNAFIAMLVRRYTAELVEDNPYINEVVLYDNGSAPLSFWRMVSKLRSGRFDVSLVTYPRVRLALLMAMARIPLRVGTGYRWYSFLFNRRVYVHRKNAAKHEAEYNMDLLGAIGCPVPHIPRPHLEIADRHRASVGKALHEIGISNNDRFAILHPGSGGSARNWSMANFAELGKRLAAEASVRVIVTGGRGEESIVRSVTTAIGESAGSIVGTLSLKEYAALAVRSVLFVGNSTGPLHIAAAVDTPVVALYPQVTPMSPNRWGPYTDRKIVLVPKNKPADCHACARRIPPGSSCECMDSITVDEVFEAVKKMISIPTTIESTPGQPR